MNLSLIMNVTLFNIITYNSLQLKATINYKLRLNLKQAMKKGKTYRINSPLSLIFLFVITSGLCLAQNKEP